MFDLILTLICDNAALRTPFPLSECELKSNSFLDLKLFGTIDTGQGSKCFGTTTIISLNMKLRFWCAECLDWNKRCTSGSILMWFVHSKLASIFSIENVNMISKSTLSKKPKNNMVFAVFASFHSDWVRLNIILSCGPAGWKQPPELHPSTGRWQKTWMVFGWISGIDFCGQNREQPKTVKKTWRKQNHSTPFQESAQQFRSRNACIISCSSRKALDGKGESGKPFGLKSRVGPAFFSPPVT